jgi:hypothetical protein
VFFKLIDKEKIRANHFYNTGEELPDDMLEMLYQQGEGNFNQGGRVGKFMGGMSDAQRKSGGSTHSDKPEGPDNNMSGSTIDDGFNTVSSEVNKIVQDDGTFLNSSTDFTNPDTGEKKVKSIVQTPSFFQRMFTMPTGYQDIMTVDDEGKTFSTNQLTGPQTLKYSPFNQGGRVGMFAGGSLIGKGIMEAAKLAQKGVKPFGAKQTYKQNVKMVGMDEFQKAMKKNFDKELYDINKVRGPRGNPEAELFDLYEDIASGARYSMLPETTRSKMLSQIDDSLKAMEVDGAEYQNFRAYLFDEYKFPNETAYKEPGSNVISFKPKTKKANGGTVPPLKGPASDGMGSLFRRK